MFLGLKIPLLSLFLFVFSVGAASAVTVSGAFSNPIPCNRFEEVSFTQTGTNAFSTFQFRTVNGCPGRATYRGFRVQIRLNDKTDWDDLTVGFIRDDNTLIKLKNFDPLPSDPTILRSIGGRVYSNSLGDLVQPDLLISFTDKNAPATLGVALQPIPLPPAALGLLAALAVLALFGSARPLAGAAARS